MTPVTSAKTDAERKFSSLDQRHRLRLLIKLVRAKRHELAAKLLEAYPLSGPYARNRTLFVRGMIQKARGDLKPAADNFRAALADDPNLTMVRMELAQTLFLMEEDTGAKHHLELLRGAAPSADIARNFDNFIDAIDARRPWHFNAYVAMAPSTNFNNGTSREVVIINGLPFQIAQNSRESSGVGIRGGANGSYTHRLGKDLSIIASAGVNLTEHNGDEFDDLIASQSLGLRRKHARGSVEIGAILTERWTGETEFLTTVGPQITIKQLLAPKLAIRTKLRHAIYDYRDTDFRDGSISSFDNRLSYSIEQGTVGYVIAGFERGVTQLDYLDYWAVYGGLAAYYEAPWGITLYGETKLRGQFHDGRFPLLGFLREDTKIDVALSVTKRDFEIFGLAPQFQYTYTRNFSNSPFAEYHAHGAQATLTKKF